MLGGDCVWWGPCLVGTETGGDRVWWGLCLVGRSLLEALGRDGTGLSTAEPDEVPACSVTRLLGWIPEG